MSTGVAPALSLNKVVVLGANGAMGAGSGALFATGGCEVTLVARERAKVEGALTAVQGVTKSVAVEGQVKLDTYDAGLDTLCQDADLIFECVAEDLALKRGILGQVDRARPQGSLVATVSSGLSIVAMAEGLSADFKRHFCGIHLYNPPHMMTGVEVIPHPDMPAELVEHLREQLAQRFGRNVVICSDMPAFAGNRVGFKVLNEVAQLAVEHGVQKMDYLVGPYTGRAMPPLATVDLVGWDVHKAIVDNVYDNTNDEAHAAFKLPDYMNTLVAKGHLGDKTPATGGFFKRVREQGQPPKTSALDPHSGDYKDLENISYPFVEQVRDFHHRGRYRDGVNAFMDAEGPEADLARRVILGYVSYGLNRCGPNEVVKDYADIDRIMTAGFNWAPPSGLVDYIGLDRTIAALERYNLPVPALLTAAQKGEVKTPLFNLPFVSVGRYFSG